MQLRNWFTADLQQVRENRIPAGVTAVHKEQYAVVCERGETCVRLKSSEYYAGIEAFPTALTMIPAHIRGTVEYSCCDASDVN